MSNTWVNSPYNQGTPGSNVISGGGGGSMVLNFRTPLDARRSAAGSIPEAEYPDGYLGTIINRREDKLLKNVKNRLTDRSYQRGVHAGEKVSANSYFWDSDFNPKKGLEYEAKGLKWTAKGSTPTDKLAHSGKTDFISPAERQKLYGQYGVQGAYRDIVQIQDPERRQSMQRLLPPWSA